MVDKFSRIYIEINELLAYCTPMPDDESTARLCRRIIKKLPMTYYGITLEISELRNRVNPKKYINKKMRKIGQVFYREEGMIAALVYSGYFDMNPSVLSVQFLADKIRILGIAKEGLLSQKTAYKATEKLRKIIV